MATSLKLSRTTFPKVALPQLLVETAGPVNASGAHPRLLLLSQLQLQFLLQLLLLLLLHQEGEELLQL